MARIFTVKSLKPSLGGAKRRGDLLDICPVTKRLLFARVSRPLDFTVVLSSVALLSPAY